jgi:hypothetical protein
LTDALQQELIPRSRVATGQVPEDAEVTLKGNQQMITVSRMFVATQIPGAGPVEPTFILRFGMVEQIMSRLGVACATPYPFTRCPATPRGCKVGTEDAFQILLDNASLPAIPDPVPEFVGGILPARGYEEGNAR